MIKILQFIFRTVPSHTWRGGFKGILTSTFAFYLMHLSEHSLVNKYLTLLVNNSIGRFFLIYMLVYIFFYWVVDTLLRLLAFKLVKSKLVSIFERESKKSKREIVKGINIVKNGLTNFVMGYTVDLGYVTKNEIKEIGNIDLILVTPGEKEKAINEIITALNKWACVLIHLLFSLALVWDYDKVLVTIIFVLGFVFTVLLYFGLMVFVQNVEVIIALLRKEVRRIR